MLRLLALLLVLVVVQVSAASPPDNPCDPKALLPPTDPAYGEAMKLSQTLNRHGIHVRCVMLSKEARMYDGLGAAFFRTDMGDFDARFLPPSQSWDKLKVFEDREYSGTWEGKSVYFVKHRNQFLHSLDQQVVSMLREALQRN